MRLRDLDAHVVPAAAERLGSLLVWIDTPRRGPRLGFVVVAMLFFAGAGVLGSHEKARARPDASPSSLRGPVDPLGTVALGPDVGASVADYVASAGASLDEAATGDPDGSRLALVSLTSYQTAAQTAGLFKGVQVKRVYLRAEAAGPEAAQLPVDITDLATDLARSYAQTAQGRAKTQREYLKFVDTIDVQTKEEKGFKTLYAQLAKAAGTEAKAYRGACACVFAALVQEPVRRLLELQGRPGVRAVQVATAGVALPGAQVLPLLPEAVTVVPKRQVVP